MNHASEHGNARSSGPNWSRINQWLLWVGLAAAVGWMFYRHNAHVAQLLPFLILLACPLMHLFGHGGHGGHGGHRDGSDTKPKDDSGQRPAGGRGGHEH
jgi:hypothetical protein